MSDREERRVNPWVPRERVSVDSPGQGDQPRQPNQVEPRNQDGARPDSLDAAVARKALAGTAARSGGLVAWYASDRQRVEALPAHRRVPVWKGAVRPHLGGREADVDRAGWWWLGVHGGSGVTTLAGFVPGGADAHRWWPDPSFGGPHAVVLVCRSHLRGIERAREAAAQWAASDVPAGLLLAGAVVVADAPSRPARAQVEAMRLLEGVVPRLWAIPWIDDLRCLPPGETLPLPPAVLPLRSDLAALASATTAGCA